MITTTNGSDRSASGSMSIRSSGRKRRKAKLTAAAEAAATATEAIQAPEPAPKTPAATYPRSVMFSTSVNANVVEASFSSADPNTLAAARISDGHRIGISLQFAAPPAKSLVRTHFSDGITDDCVTTTVVATHGDSLLLQVYHFNNALQQQEMDYFVYNAGTAGTNSPQPPSLSLLPQCPSTDRDEGCKRPRWLEGRHTGILRRGEDEVIVAELNPAKGELLRLRSREWSIIHPAINNISGDLDTAVLATWQRVHSVIPIGDEHLCFANLYNGLLFCDVFTETPVLRYVPLPVDAAEPLTGPGSSRDVCSVANGSTVKLINICPRCCCGGAGGTNCQHSYRAYTIVTWTLNMDNMTWVMDGMVDSTDLWSVLDGGGVPRVKPSNPVVSTDDPNVISLVLYVGEGGLGNSTVWLITVDTRSKAVLSVCRNTQGNYCFDSIQSNVSDYFNPDDPSSGKVDVVDDDQLQAKDANIVQSASSIRSTIPTQEAPIKAEASPSIIFAALQGIPGLARGHMLQAYRILCHDSTGRRFQSLLGLPMSFRKEWVLLEIEATQACSICSACTADT